MFLRGEKDMKRFAVIIIATVLLFSTCLQGTYAAVPNSGAVAQKMIMFYLKPDISVELNGVRQVFKDANGQTVYPIINNGTTYLPVRAVSAIMKEPVEWDSGSNTIFIGKTLTNPTKTNALIPTDAAAAAEESDNEELAGLKPGLVAGYTKYDVLVMYDFEEQTFKDVSGLTVYPINYKGSTYLPIRAISALMGKEITWDGAAKLISIEDIEDDENLNDETTSEDNDDEDTSDDEDHAAVMHQLKSIYESEEALYYEASAKVSSIKEASSEEKQAIATSASDNYLKAQTTTEELKDLDSGGYTENELNSYGKLLEFAESNEYYILVLENIAYMAAEDQDYSMLADTFLYFAMDAQTKMKAAEDAIYGDD
jgi:hypothetical protein